MARPSRRLDGRVDRAGRRQRHTLSPGRRPAILRARMVRKVGSSRIVREIGRGGMGVVYEAFQEGLDRPVAVKALDAKLARSKEMVERFRREGRAYAKLRHEAIVQVHDLVEKDDGLYLVTELVDGTDLARLLAQGGALPPDCVALVGARVADALDYVHFNALLHRDVKPANVMVSRDGEVKLMDFGIAKGEDDPDPHARRDARRAAPRTWPPRCSPAARPGRWPTSGRSACRSTSSSPARSRSAGRTPTSSSPRSPAGKFPSVRVARAGLPAPPRARRRALPRAPPGGPLQERRRPRAGARRDRDPAPAARRPPARPRRRAPREPRLRHRGGRALEARPLDAPRDAHRRRARHRHQGGVPGAPAAARELRGDGAARPRRGLRRRHVARVAGSGAQPSTANRGASAQSPSRS